MRERVRAVNDSQATKARAIARCPRERRSGRGGSAEREIRTRRGGVGREQTGIGQQAMHVLDGFFEHVETGFGRFGNLRRHATGVEQAA